MPLQVFLTDDASRDLEEFYDYIESHDALGRVDYVLERIEKAFCSLFENPGREAYPKELLAVGLREYREIFFQTLPHHLPGHGRKSLCEGDCRRPPRHADTPATASFASITLPFYAHPSMRADPPL